uniref:SnoaL-like domain-containing protein n=1 Tax=Fervidobacterium nodosum TaxID=2424 RepID=A0A7C5Y8E9_9BACT
MIDKNNSFEEEIRLVLENYLKTYLIDRNFEEVLKYFHPKLSGIGTGEDEIGLTYEQSVWLYQREMSQYPETIPYQITLFKAFEVTPKVALALCGLEFNLRMEETDYKIERLRMSMLFVKERESWLIYHLHISQSELDLSKDESVPLKKMEEKNRWLQEKLDEHTKDLQNALENAKICQSQTN